MGFPFDRMPRLGVNTLQQFLTSNMFVLNTTIRHTNRTVATVQNTTQQGQSQGSQSTGTRGNQQGQSGQGSRPNPTRPSKSSTYTVVVLHSLFNIFDFIYKLCEYLTQFFKEEESGKIIYMNSVYPA